MFDYDDNHEESLRTRADRERVKDKRTREQKLLDKIFDAASSPEECKKSIELLKKETGKDRAGLVEKYTTAGTSSSSRTEDGGFFDQLGTIISLQEHIRALERKLARARDDHESMMKAMSSSHDEWHAKLGQLEDVARRLAAAAFNAMWLKPSARAMLGRAAKFRPDWIDEVDELIHMGRWVVEGPINEAISKANAAIPNEDTDQSVVKELSRLLAGGPKTTGEIKVAVDARPKLRDALARDMGVKGEINAIKLGLYLKQIEGRVVGKVKLVGRRDAHRKQMVWMTESVSG